jgi:lysine-specific demethylase/histidyl-hydroxylase NO66
MDLDEAPGSRWWETDDVWQRLVGDRDLFAKHWGRSPHLSCSTAHLAAIFDVADAEVLLTSALRRPAFRLVRDGTGLAEGAGTRSLRLGGRHLDDVADPERISAAYAAGATVVLQGLHRTDRRVASFADALAGPSGHGVQVNAYLSPPGSHGLGSHADGHDVLVLQVRGSKHWSVDGMGDVTMSPGAVLYVPAGVEHAARTVDDPSLHLTIGLLRVDRRRVIADLLAAVPELDAPLPPWFATDPSAAASEVRASIDHAIDALRRADVGDVTRSQIERSRRRARPQPTGWLRSLVEVDAIGEWSTVVLRDDCSWPADLVDDRAGIARGRRTLTMPPIAADALHSLLTKRSMRVGELPGLDAASRLVLARRLVRERFATIVDR